MRKDNGSLYAIVGVGILAGMASLGSRGSRKTQPPGGPGGFDLDALFNIKEIEATPPNCDIWLLNDDAINGAFVEDALVRGLGMSDARANQLMWTAHREGRVHVLKTDCPAGRDKLAKIAVIAGEWDPSYARVFILKQDDE